VAGGWRGLSGGAGLITPDRRRTSPTA
jgi:hypothetical protein